MPPRSKKDDRLKILGQIQTPLGFYVLALLIIEKEEHSAPQIEPSALRDQIEDIIHQRVKPEYLKPSKEE